MVAAKHDSEHVHETYLLARKLYEKENFPEAERLLEKLSTEAPFFADVFNKLGVIYHQRGAFGRASKAFEKALELNPHYTEAALNLAVTYNNLGRYEYRLACRVCGTAITVSKSTFALFRYLNTRKPSASFLELFDLDKKSCQSNP